LSVSYIDIGDVLNAHGDLEEAQVPNHGGLWKSLMTAHLGDYTAAERRLRRIATLQMSS
jgi:hypothetical protein